MDFYQNTALFVAIIVGVFIFTFSSAPFPPSTSKTFSFLSVVYHAGVFFLFSSFLFLGVKAYSSFMSKKFFIAVFLSLLYAILDELHQYFVPGRAMDIIDVWYDFAGSFMSFVFLGFIRWVNGR